MDAHREELIARVAESIAGSFNANIKAMHNEGLSPEEASAKIIGENMEEFLKVRQQIRDNGISMEELMGYLKKKNKIESSESGELVGYKNLLFYQKAAFVENGDVLIRFLENADVDDDGRKEAVDKWVHNEVVGGFVWAFMGFSKEMESVLDAAVFKLEVVDGKVQCNTAQCYFPNNESIKDFEEYTLEFAKNAYISIEIRHLKLMESLSVAYLRDQKIQKIYYFSLKGEYEVRKIPDLVFSDKESHDQWVESKIAKFEQAKEQKLKEAIKEIFKGDDIEIHKVSSTDELQKIMDEAKKKKNKQGGRFDFLDN